MVMILKNLILIQGCKSFGSKFKLKLTKKATLKGKYFFKLLYVGTIGQEKNPNCIE